MIVPRLPLVLGLALVLVLGGSASCAPSHRGTTAQSPLAPSPETAPGTSPSDAGAPRACIHDAKDLAPCAEDCERGIVFACTVVAGRTERGDGIGKDLTRAVHLHERACDLGDAPSCVSAARMHASGRGVPPNRVTQIQLLAHACTLGDAHACSIPAKAFQTGTDVPRDLRRAAELWQQACAAGDTAACAVIEGESP